MLQQIPAPFFEFNTVIIKSLCVFCKIAYQLATTKYEATPCVDNTAITNQPQCYANIVPGTILTLTLQSPAH